MSRAAGIGAGLQAAAMLACGRREGLALLAAEPSDELAAAQRSFWAVVLCLPAFVALHLLDWAQSGVPAHAAIAFAWDLASYAAGWAGFALLSHMMAARVGLLDRWPRFIAIWNWCNVIQYLMLVVAALPTLLGLPDAVAQTAWLVAMGWALWLEWTAARLALGIRPLAAAALVGLDVTLGLMLVTLSAAYVAG